MQYLSTWLRLLRVKQWLKNGFVLAPLLFTQGQWQALTIFDALLATFIFCLASSATYIFNDWHDIDSDRLHPKKKLTRPLANGTIALKAAGIMLCVLVILIITLITTLPRITPLILFYIGLNVCYTLVLKHQPVVDIFCIATSFVLRVFAGACAIAVHVSSWMFITTLSLALFLAAIKRRQELVQHSSTSRKVLEHYSVALIERYADMASTGALVFYSLFVMNTQPILIATLPLVIFGIYRYWFIVDNRQEGESPNDSLLSDWQLLLCVTLWALLSCLAIKYPQWFIQLYQYCLTGS